MELTKKETINLSGEAKPGDRGEPGKPGLQVTGNLSTLNYALNYRDLVDPLESLERTVSLVHQERREPLESPESRDRMEPQELPETPDRLEPMENVAFAPSTALSMEESSSKTGPESSHQNKVFTSEFDVDFQA